jgi:hypothetical protein
MSIFSIVLLVFGISQLYWGWRGYSVATRLIPARGRRLAVCAVVLAAYAAVFAYNYPFFGRRPEPVHLTWRAALLTAPFLCWVVSSLLSALIVLLFAILRGVVNGLGRIGAKLRAPSAGESIESPGRRRFLERTANVAAGAPFVAGAYGLLYGRLNLETTEQPVRLARLPKAFDGFRICQLSDIHIGPFMPDEEIRKYVGIANALKPDMMVLTGDFVTFDPGTQQAVVEALSGLRAPFGVFGCLGNHDAWAGVEDSITELFRQTGVRILRGAAVPITAHGDWFQLIGVDFQSHRRFGPSNPVPHLLRNIEGLGIGHRSQHGGSHARRPGGAGIHQSRTGSVAPGHALCCRVVPQAGRATLRQPGDWNHRSSDSHRCAAGDHGLPLDAGLKPWR